MSWIIKLYHIPHIPSTLEDEQQHHCLQVYQSCSILSSSINHIAELFMFAMKVTTPLTEMQLMRLNENINLVQELSNYQLPK
jgi:hypothetical protein